MRLITNNPRNLVGLSGYGLEVTACVPFDTPESEKERTGETTADKS
jgi:GTP cyclohydrolase II